MRQQESPAIGVGSSDQVANSANVFTPPTTKYVALDRYLPLEGLRHSITPTDMHYSLRHSDLPDIDLATWRLKVEGLVARPLSLSLDEIKARPAVTLLVTLECVGNGGSNPRTLGMVGTAQWTGASLQGILKEAGVSKKAVEVLFTAFDLRVRSDKIQLYHSSLSIAEATREGVLLAYAMNGEPLPLDHGFPLRLVVPGWYGMVSVRWLDRIEALGAAFPREGLYGAWPVPDTLMNVRALMIPPGIPDPETGTPRVKAGPVTLAGRAWGAHVGVARVEVSADGGSTWAEAQLGQELSAYAWRGWTFVWKARPGQYTLCARATDVAGNVQPVIPEGKGKTAVQRVDVLVE